MGDIINFAKKRKKNLKAYEFENKMKKGVGGPKRQPVAFWTTIPYKWVWPKDSEDSRLVESAHKK